MSLRAFALFLYLEVIYMQNEIKVVIVEPHKNPTITTIKTKLENLQEAVGGLIEIIDIEDDVCILCNEEGNRKLGNDILVGILLIYTITKQYYVVWLIAHLMHHSNLLWHTYLYSLIWF